MILPICTDAAVAIVAVAKQIQNIIEGTCYGKFS